jgi:ectoine hydroxylase-related dioxygenase (phytanoyl-CoA dioxygenase family)
VFPDNFCVLSLFILRAPRHVQCVLNFLDNVDEDGGTLVVPKFHTYLPEFCAEFAHLRRPLPWVQFPGEVEAQLLRRAHRVTMRQVRRLFSSFFNTAVQVFQVYLTLVMGTYLLHTSVLHCAVFGRYF